MKYPIGIQNFEDLRRKGFVYVDKTAHVYDLADTGKYYFLGRPRRFGKSLLISTMEAYFLGKKELFKGLAMEKLEKEWNVYPVFHLDLNTGTFDSVENLRKIIDNFLVQWENIYGTARGEETQPLRFKGLISRAYVQTGRQVVILVDEYDKPLLLNFDNPDLQDKLRKELKAFYSVLKTQDQYIRFAFLTGVTKFGKVSVFSDLNNLNDISMTVRYADICGITEAEMHEYFDKSIHEFANANDMTFEGACLELRNQYDGYHFRHGGPGIYNPFSLLNALSKQEISDYWFETGTPTFLVQILQQSDYDLNDIQNGSVDASVISSVDTVTANPLPIIYQSGYLTIKDYDTEFKAYKLGFPNKEVETGFLKSLLPAFMPVKERKTEFEIKKFVKEVRSGDAESFMSRLQTFFDASDYRVAGCAEVYFQNTLFVFFRLMGFYTEVEHSTSCGRVDIILKTQDYIYIIECKFNGSASDALSQIENKGYAKPFACDPRKIFKIGVNFSSETRTMTEWKIA